MSVAGVPDIVASLGSVRERIEQHLKADVERYGALLTIERAVSELTAFQDLSASLSAIRDNVRLQLNETREFRALCAVDRILPELADVVALLAEKANVPAVADGAVEGIAVSDQEPAQMTHVESSSSDVVQAGAHEVAPDRQDQSLPEIYEAGAPMADARFMSEPVSNECQPSEAQSGDPVDVAGKAQTSQDQTPSAQLLHDQPDYASREEAAQEQPVEAPAAAATSDPAIVTISAEVMNDAALGEIPDLSEHGAAEPETEVSTLAYNLAHLLVQSLPASQPGSHAGHPEAKTSQDGEGAVAPVDLVASTPVDPAAQAGRAA